MPKIQSEFMPSTEISDASASMALRQTLDAMGGTEAWNRMGSAIARYRRSEAPANKLTDIMMLDDWSTRNIRYSRGTSGMTAKPTGHDGSSVLKVVSAKSKSTIGSISEFDQAGVLASHLPAAAALIILRNPLYLVKTSSTCGAGEMCLTIYRKDTTQSLFHIVQTWTIGKDTYLPERVSIALPTIGKGVTMKWKTVQFYSYLPEQGVKVPDRFSMAIEGMKGPVQTLVSIKLSTGYDLDAFAQEVRK